jgi:serine protease SohB|tara:strand:- start:399 stop:1448 length:1050 start_codon:yes stop_codon:yes gene_type:complete
LEFLLEYGLFLAKTVTLLVSILVIIIIVVGLGQKNKQTDKGHIEVKSINDAVDNITHSLKQMVLNPEMRKVELKSEKKKLKEEQKTRKKDVKEGAEPRGRVFVVEFEGDVQASAVAGLREEVTAILAIADEGDEVVVKLESPGGMVHSYGLAASQLERIVSRKVPLTIAVDKVAASGGYMMACIGTKIIAAPFALLGSIGVVAQIPNFHRLLKSKDVDVEVLTAGEYKRTLTMFGENTEKGREKFIQELEDVHALFKDFVSENRPTVDMQKVATGEAWYGKRALALNLVDELKTSDEYIIDKCTDRDVFLVKYVEHQNRMDKLMERFALVSKRLGGTDFLRREQGPYTF